MRRLRTIAIVGFLLLAMARSMFLDFSGDTTHATYMLCWAILTLVYIGVTRGQL